MKNRIITIGIYGLTFIALLVLVFALSGCEKTTTDDRLYEGYLLSEDEKELIGGLMTCYDSNFDAPECYEIGDARHYSREEVDQLLDELYDFYIEENEQDIEELSQMILDLEQRIEELESGMFVDLLYQSSIKLKCYSDSCSITFYQSGSPVREEYYISIDIWQIDSTTVFLDVDKALVNTHQVVSQVQLEEDTNNQSYQTFAIFLYYLAIDMGTNYDDINELYFNEID